MKNLGQRTESNDIANIEDAIQSLSSSNIRITDLDTGIYKLPTGSVFIYYKGTTAQDLLDLGNKNSTNTLLYVNKNNNAMTDSTVYKWIWHIEYYTTETVDPVIYLGETTLTSGSYKTLTYAEFGYLSGLTSNVQTQLNGKQPTLVSGTNIKTINGVSVLGSGDIPVGGGTATDVQINGTSITSSNVANIITNSAYNSSSNKIATMNDVPSTYVSSVNGDSGAITNVEKTTNKVTSWSSTVTDTHYPSEKLVYSSKLGSPQNNYVTSKQGIASSVNQGGTVWSSSEIDRACIVYIRGQFTGSSLFTLYSSDGTARVYREITGVNSIMFICKKGDYIVWTTKGNTAWAETQKVNFGGVVTQ